MRDVYVLASSTTQFQRWPDRTHEDLAREAVLSVLRDASLTDGSAIASAHVGSCALHLFGQSNIRGQALLWPLSREGRLSSQMPIINVEAGCATGGVAFNGAWMAVASGQSELALALGVEKTFIPSNPKQMFTLFESGLDQLHAEQWRALYAEYAAACGTTWAPKPERSVILDAANLSMSWHMKRYGTTARQLALVSSKNHANGALNPNAQYGPMSVDEVLADKPVLGPLTRSMCAPISDGAAAVLVCSREFLQRHREGRQRVDVRVAGTVLANGARWRPDEPPVTKFAALRAYDAAKVSADVIDVAEVHDSTAFAEISALESLGFCKEGEGGPFSESGATSITGTLPINTSGGLESKGHPLAASGLAMIHELTLQLRGEARERQVKAPEWALAHNAGGMIGFDEAMCSVTILQRA